MFCFVKQKRAQLITKVFWSELNPGKKKNKIKITVYKMPLILGFVYFIIILYYCYLEVF